MTKAYLRRLGKALNGLVCKKRAYSNKLKCFEVNKQKLSEKQSHGKYNRSKMVLQNA